MNFMLSPSHSIADTTSTTYSDGAPYFDKARHIHSLEMLEILPRILKEGIIFAGSGAALLLQAALPSIRDTEVQSSGHKALATELINALQAHISYISILVFGTRAERTGPLDALQQRETPGLGGGRNNRFAHHPKLQMWIAATLYATATDLYQRVYGRVDCSTARRAYSEFSVLITCLGVPVEEWPESQQEFWIYWDNQITKLSVSPSDALFAKDLVESIEMPGWVQRLKVFLRAVTIEMLPPRIRDLYGLRSTSSTRFLYRTSMGFSRAVYPAFPKKIRSYPLRYYQQRLWVRMNLV